MSKITSNHIFTSESVSEGHPDKICDQISDAILDACLRDDPDSRVACECLVTSDLAVIAGEITTASEVDFDRVARDTIRQIGYIDNTIGFSADECKIFLCLHKQSQDIAQGVNETTNATREQGAGDQGMMFGYATDETPELMPAPIIYAHQIMARLASLRKSKPKKYPFLRPDAKAQVSINYRDCVPESIHSIVVSHQHTPEMKDETLAHLIEETIAEVIPASLRHKKIQYYINPTGRFVIGGPHGDTGLTGRKIIVDTYGGVGSHGGGAFSGKDPSKVDRSAAYMCRYIAKNIVAAGIARRCEIQVAYAIGVAKPVSVNVDTYGTSKVDEAILQKILEANVIFDLRPKSIVETLGLKYPFRNNWNYKSTAAYGHFGRLDFPWEATNKVDALKKAVKTRK